MRILVIGGTKFIGPFVVEQLVERSCEVDVLHRGVHEARLPHGVRQIRSELAGIPVTAFPSEVSSAQYDVVIHMIAMGEADAQAAIDCFGGRTGRLIVLSSGDVYRAYGVFSGLEAGPLESMPLAEASPLRTQLYPYRKNARSKTDLEYWYEKILMEQAILKLGKVSRVLRLPKVYGPGNNDDFATVHQYRHHPGWRWTHGYVENVATAVVAAALHPTTEHQIFNVGEDSTPTIGERLEHLPPSSISSSEKDKFNFEQDIVYDTSRIRTELGYREIISYQEGIRRTIGLT